MNRREVLSLGAVALTGCIGGSGSGPGFESHPATAGIENVPSIGQGSDKHVVAFEDPSCPSCASHHENAFPSLEEDALNDELVYHVRTIPIVRPDWSEPACNALFSTHGRSSETFWTLLDSYYQGQRQTNADNVYDRTRGYLEDESVDAEGVVEDARQEAFSDEVNANMSAARDADVSATPTFYLFDENGFVTETTGARGYDVFATALGL
jgi:protein-disulfide isomerase